MSRRVLFVSKAVVPPFHDGSKCLVRDVASHLRRVSPVIMTSRQIEGDSPLDHLERVAVYRGRGGFAPSLYDNAGVARHLLFERRADLWHFVMAPSPRTGRIARWLKTVRRIPVVQTFASQPRSFEPISSLLFGDVVVAQSEWTRARIIAAAKALGRSLEIEMIPPPLAAVVPPSPQDIARARQEIAVSSAAPLLLYPGDLEVSQGAQICASLMEPILREIPDAVFVFACREKTPRAREIKEQLAARLPAQRARFVGEVSHFKALLAAADAILFPVDDLWGKVDLPIALLEALALGAPVLALAQGPLLDLADGAELIGSTAPEPWVAAMVQLAQHQGRREELAQRGRAFVAKRHDAATIAAAYERIYERLLAR